MRAPYSRFCDHSRVFYALVRAHMEYAECECVIMILAMSMSRTSWVKCIVAVDASEQHSRITRAFAEVCVGRSRSQREVKQNRTNQARCFCCCCVVVPVRRSCCLFVCAGQQHAGLSGRPSMPTGQVSEHEAREPFCIHTNTHTHTSYVLAKNMRNASQVLSAEMETRKGRVEGGRRRDANMQYRIAGW